MRMICSLIACICLMALPLSAQPNRNDELQPGQVDLQLAGEIELGILIDIISERLGINIVSSSEHDSKKILIRSNEPVPEGSLLSLLEISMRSHDLILAPSADPHWYTIVDSKDLLAGCPAYAQLKQVLTAVNVSPSCLNPMKTSAVSRAPGVRSSEGGGCTHADKVTFGIACRA